MASHDTPSSLVENTQEVRVKHDNIFVTNTNQKVPFNFARSGTVESENSAAAGRKQPSDISIWLGSRVESITHQSGGPLFNGGLEFQSARDLGNLRLTVLAVQSGSSLLPLLICHRYLPIDCEIFRGGSPWASAMGHRSMAKFAMLDAPFLRIIY